MEIKEKMKSGMLYCNTDPGLEEEQIRSMDQIFMSNRLLPSQWAEREAILKELFASLGEGCFIVPPFFAPWGKNIHFGKGIFANTNLRLLDDTDIYVGDDVMFAPNVTITTAAHPIDPTLRKKKMEYNLPVHIGANAWLGTGVIVLPGVTIGENAVIGAGSVVTKNIPGNVVAVGNPCRVLREITDHDREYYFQDRKIDPALFED